MPISASELSFANTTRKRVPGVQIKSDERERTDTIAVPDLDRRIRLPCCTRPDPMSVSSVEGVLETVIVSETILVLAKSSRQTSTPAGRPQRGVFETPARVCPDAFYSH